MSFRQTIINFLEKKGRGSIFFNADFSFLNNDSYVRSVLTHLVKENFVVRLRKGIYIFPVLDEADKPVLPSYNEVADAISNKTTHSK